MKISPQPNGVSNRILSLLPIEDYQRLTREAKYVSLPSGAPLYESNEPITNVHFILEGIGSVVTTMEEGTSIEVMVVGREGMVGLPALESSDTVVPTTAYMQVPGSAIQISAAAVRQEFNRISALHALSLQYLQFALIQVSQSAACNRLHDLEERLARWLLMVHDRVRVDEFDLTHEFLAQMLGTRRSSVTLSAGVLQRAGLIDYRRGHMRIVKRTDLENVACQCYPIIKRSWDRLLEQDKART